MLYGGGFRTVAEADVGTLQVQSVCLLFLITNLPLTFIDVHSVAGIVSSNLYELTRLILYWAWNPDGLDPESLALIYHHMPYLILTVTRGNCSSRVPSGTFLCNFS